jgi:hypothetical protein
MEGYEEGTTEVCAIRNADGTFRFCVDEEYAIEAGIDPSLVFKIPVPKDLIATGSVTQIGEYIATYLEAQNDSPL